MSLSQGLQSLRDAELDAVETLGGRFGEGQVGETAALELDLRAGISTMDPDPLALPDDALQRSLTPPLKQTDAGRDLPLGSQEESPKRKRDGPERSGHLLDVWAGALFARGPSVRVNPRDVLDLSAELREFLLPLLHRGNDLLNEWRRVTQQLSRYEHAYSVVPSEATEDDLRGARAKVALCVAG